MSTPSPGVANPAEGTKYAHRVLEGFVEGPRTHYGARPRTPAIAKYGHMTARPPPAYPAVDMPVTLNGVGSSDYPGRI